MTIEDILTDCRGWLEILSGNEVGPTGMTWQDIARALANDLAAAADACTAMADGKGGEVSWPSWQDIDENAEQFGDVVAMTLDCSTGDVRTIGGGR